MSTEYDAIYQAVYDAFPTASAVTHALSEGVSEALPHSSRVIEVFAAKLEQALPDDEEVLRVFGESCTAAFQWILPCQGDILEAIQQGVYDAVMSRLSSG